jgi:hypothetical protein
MTSSTGNVLADMLMGRGYQPPMGPIQERQKALEALTDGGTIRDKVQLSSDAYRGGATISHDAAKGEVRIYSSSYSVRFTQDADNNTTGKYEMESGGGCGSSGRDFEVTVDPQGQILHAMAELPNADGLWPSPTIKVDATKGTVQVENYPKREDGFTVSGSQQDVLKLFSAMAGTPPWDMERYQSGAWPTPTARANF